jgi:hypothetical protein
MEIVADLREGVLRGFALEVAQLVHAAALHRGPRPHQLDGAPQPGITVGKVVSAPVLGVVGVLPDGGKHLLALLGASLAGA